MAKIVKRKIRWVSSQASDVVGYKVYYVVGGGAIDYASTPFKEVNSNISQLVVPDDLPELANVDSDVTIGVAAVDDIGNESDVTEVTVPFDFAAPDVPTGLVVETF